MGTATSREALQAVIRDTDDRAQVSIGLLSYMSHLMCPDWALHMTTLRIRQQGKLDLALELISLVKRHLEGVPVHITQLKSGSTSEGMCLPTTCKIRDNEVVHMEMADIDILAINMGMVVATSVAEAQALGTNLVLDTSYTHAAFAQIQVMYYSGYITPYVCLSRERQGKKQVYLSHEIHREMFGHLGKDDETLIHGPAVTNEWFGSLADAELESSIDYVYSIRCSGWPGGLQGWAQRPRTQGWPSQDTIDTVLRMPCYLVPVAHKLTEDPEIEWRISFSAAELIIADTFTIHKRQVYILFKYLVKQAISGLGCGICTYHLKTTFSWANESIPGKYWAPHRIGSALLAVLDVLEGFLQKHCIPNYFYPKSNLIAHLTKEQMNTVLTVVQSIRTDPLTALLDTQDRVRFEGQPLKNSFKSLFGHRISQINDLILAGKSHSSDDVMWFAMAHASEFLSWRYVKGALHAADWHRELAQALLNIDITEAHMWYHMYHVVLWTCSQIDFAIEFVDCAISQCEALVPEVPLDQDFDDWVWVHEKNTDYCGREVPSITLSDQQIICEVISMLKALLGQLYNIKMHDSVGNTRQICEVRCKALLEDAKKMLPSVMCNSEYTAYFRRRNALLSKTAVLAKSDALKASDVQLQQYCDQTPRDDSLQADFNSLNKNTLLEMLEKTTYWLEMLPILTQMSDDLARAAKFGNHWKSFLVLEGHILEEPLRSLVLEMDSQSQVTVPYEIYLLYSVAVRIQGITLRENNPSEIMVQQMHMQVHSMAVALLALFSEVLKKQHEFMPDYIRAPNATLCLSTVFLMQATVAWQDGSCAEAMALLQNAYTLTPHSDTLKKCLQLQNGDNLQELFQRQKHAEMGDGNITIVEEDAGAKSAFQLLGPMEENETDNESVETRRPDFSINGDSGSQGEQSPSMKSNDLLTENQKNDLEVDGQGHCNDRELSSKELGVDSCVDDVTATDTSSHGENACDKLPGKPVDSGSGHHDGDNKTCFMLCNQESKPESLISCEAPGAEMGSTIQQPDKSAVESSCPGSVSPSPGHSPGMNSPRIRQRSLKSKIVDTSVWILALPVIGVLYLGVGAMKCLVKATPYIAPILYNARMGMHRLKGSFLGWYDITPPEDVKDLEWINGTFRPSTPEDVIPTVKNIDSFAAIVRARGIDTDGIWPMDQESFFSKLKQLDTNKPADTLAHLDDIVEPGALVNLDFAGVHAELDSFRSVLIKNGQKHIQPQLPSDINFETAIKYKIRQELWQQLLSGSSTSDNKTEATKASASHTPNSEDDDSILCTADSPHAD